MFFPDSLEKGYTPRLGQNLWIPVEEEVDIHNVHIKYPSNKKLILYLHGNKGNVRRCIRQTQQFQSMGYDILIPDYRSYGLSQGHLENEAQMFQDVQKIYDAMASQYDEISVVGYSMGSGMAAYLAANNTVKNLILIAPYVSLVDMKNRYLPFIPSFLLKYKFHTDQHLKKVSCPITLIHGDRDEVIPFDSSVMLKSMIPKANFISLAGVSHRSVIFNAAIQKAVASFD